jgi:hypothetical protein
VRGTVTPEVRRRDGPLASELPRTPEVGPRSSAGPSVRFQTPEVPQQPSPSTALSRASQVSQAAAEQVRKMISEGKFKPRDPTAGGDRVATSAHGLSTAGLKDVRERLLRDEIDIEASSDSELEAPGAGAVGLVPTIEIPVTLPESISTIGARSTTPRHFMRDGTSLHSAVAPIPRRPSSVSEEKTASAGRQKASSTAPLAGEPFGTSSFDHGQGPTRGPRPGWIEDHQNVEEAGKNIFGAPNKFDADPVPTDGHRPGRQVQADRTVSRDDLHTAGDNVYTTPDGMSRAWAEQPAARHQWMGHPQEGQDPYGRPLYSGPPPYWHWVPSHGPPQHPGDPHRPPPMAPGPHAVPHQWDPSYGPPQHPGDPHPHSMAPGPNGVPHQWGPSHAPPQGHGDSHPHSMAPGPNGVPHHWGQSQDQGDPRRWPANPFQYPWELVKDMRICSQWREEIVYPIVQAAQTKNQSVQEKDSGSKLFRQVMLSGRGTQIFKTDHQGQKGSPEFILPWLIDSVAHYPSLTAYIRDPVNGLRLNAKGQEDPRNYRDGTTIGKMVDCIFMGKPLDAAEVGVRRLQALKEVLATTEIPKGAKGPWAQASEIESQMTKVGDHLMPATAMEARHRARAFHAKGTDGY